MTTERYWIDHCIGIARDAGNVDAAQDATRELEALRSQLTASEKDAARYRWLRDGNNENYGVAVEIAQDMYGTDWDEEIDAAMEKAKCKGG